MIGVIVPTFGRADRLTRVADNILDVAAVPTEVIFAVEPSDTESIAAAGLAGAAVVENTGRACYAGAANSAYQQVGEAFSYLFAGSDDLRFHLGWDERCLELMDGQFKVVGTNDLLNPYVQRGWHATHYLIERSYLDEEGGTVDGGPGSFLHPYLHNWTDTEFVATAKARVRFRPCLGAVVEHMHHSNGKSKLDDGYAKAVATEDEDRLIYEQRRELWWGLSR